MRVVFFGSPAFALPSLEAVTREHQVVAVVSQPDRPAGRGKRLHPPPVKELALRLGLPVEQPIKVRDGALAKLLWGLQPDVFVVVAYGRILPPDLLAVPKLGAWNVHASLLPKYRGAAPIQWAVIRGESKTGVCVMRMEEGLDTGPVAASQEEPIRDDDTAGTLAGRLARLCLERGEPDLQDPQLSFQLAQALPDLDFLHALLARRSETGRLKELNHYLAGYIPRQRRIERVKHLAPTNGFGRGTAEL